MQFEELKAIFTSDTDWKALRAQIDQLKEQRALAQNNLEQAQLALQALQGEPIRPSLTEKTLTPVDTSSQDDESLSPTSQPEAMPKPSSPLADLEAYAQLSHTLQGKLQAETERNAQLTEEISQVRMLLQAHEQSLRSAEVMQKKLDSAEEDAREWRRLNELLGSADGKKFRTVAQSYTFSYLVAHANHHLRQLSPRYELHNVAGTLALEIIDHDMFDEHRYVTSISGGETFVVSLALALGLASMSSSQLVIGSLFIDEGFGNLDRDSLDLVMLALSNLEDTQGRKVGVISHTDQIREQINPQIRLRKRPGGGSSVIEVV